MLTLGHNYTEYQKSYACRIHVSVQTDNYGPCYAKLANAKSRARESREPGTYCNISCDAHRQVTVEATPGQTVSSVILLLSRVSLDVFQPEPNPCAACLSHMDLHRRTWFDPVRSCERAFTEVSFTHHTAHIPPEGNSTTAVNY